MEKGTASGLTGSEGFLDNVETDLLEQIHRELKRIDMPCTCKDQLDRTILAIETWQKLKMRKKLSQEIVSNYNQLVSGLAFMSELSQLRQNDLSKQEMQDHAESLRFLADTADRCARQLYELERLTSEH